LKNVIYVNFLEGLYVVGWVHDKYLIHNSILEFHWLEYKFYKIEIIADVAD